MNNCKYSKNEIVENIEHEKCTNEELKQLNKSKDDIPCMHNCNQYKSKEGKSIATSDEKTNEK